MEATENRVLPPLPPPPPPPPPPALSQVTKITTPSLQQPQSNFHLNMYLFDNVEGTPACFYRILNPIIQEGPCCGLVALTMASQFFKGRDLTSDEVLAAAKSAKFTKSGEMFSAYNMATLAMSLLDCEARVISDLTLYQKDILSHICHGFPVLIPYDGDKNHSPCLNNGRKAHWAVLCGLCFDVPDDVLPVDSDEVEDAYSMDKTQAEMWLNSATKICVYAYQGKSRRLALWDFNRLLQSNQNLFEVTTKYHPDDMVLPEGDAMSELRDKAVLLKGNLQ